MKTRQLVLLMGAAMLLCACATTPEPPKATLKVRKAALAYQGGKIAIPDEIEGYRLAVDVLKGAMINSLLDLYTDNHEGASYRIVGHVFAKKHWRKRLFVYYNLNLRLIDRGGNLVMTFSNEEPLFQTEIAEFTDRIARAIRE
jgi:hypothetical protein